MRTLEQVLLGHGVALDGWELALAYAISDDGRSVLGRGTTPEGDWEPFLVVIPEPSTALLFGLGLIGLARSSPQFAGAPDLGGFS